VYFLLDTQQEYQFYAEEKVSVCLMSQKIELKLNKGSIVLLENAITLFQTPS
jgi:hypothetical protein